jgi:hypothetical protein
MGIPLSPPSGGGRGGARLWARESAACRVPPRTSRKSKGSVTMAVKIFVLIYSSRILYPKNKILIRKMYYYV